MTLRRPSTSQQDGADVEAGAELRKIERPLQTFLGSVDDAAVIAEHEAADCRDGDDCGNEGAVYLRCLRLLHDPLPICLF
jgi:hypothetical protein